MFEHLAANSRILVTGPQRSGTTICAAMIAQDTGHALIPEEEIDVGKRELIDVILRTRTHFVLQCPGLCHAIEQLPHAPFIVLMRRPIADILASQQRIGWPHEPEELRKLGVTEGIAAQLKYERWDTVQRSQIRDALEVQYDSLAAHPLWVPQRDRKDFLPRQTRPALLARDALA